MLDEILKGNLNEANDLLKSKLLDKVQDKLQEMKVAVGKKMFKDSDADSDFDDSEDEKEPDADDNKFSNSFVGRLKNAEDMDDEDTGISDAHREMSLKDGSMIKLEKGDARNINSFLMGLKPDTRKEVLDNMQKSNTNFNAIHDIVKKYPDYKQDNSIYKESDYSYSAKQARAGKDIGKPGKNFDLIAKKASKKYGSKEAGERVAGAILAKLRNQ